MYIDGCQHSFDHLAHSILPAHMERLKLALSAMWPMSIFAQDRVGPTSIARHCGHTSDFSGVYVLVEKDRPIYVGISRKVICRLRQHVRGKTHFDASFAYSVARRRLPTDGTRNTTMSDPVFRETFNGAQGYLRGLSVAFITIDNPLELYLFEAYAAMALGTHEWNTFRTH